MQRLTLINSNGESLPDKSRLLRYAYLIDSDFYDLKSYNPIMEHPFHEFLANRAYQDITRETTPCCLRAEDRHCEGYGMQHFDPFLDPTVVNFMFSIPSSLKIRDGVTKHLLREAMRGVLPETTRKRIKKTGWNAPAHRWFSGRGLQQIRDMIASRSFRERGIYKIPKLTQLLDEHEHIIENGKNKDNHMMFLWQLVNLEIWLQWLDSDMPNKHVN